jgi:ribosomal protein L40E
MTPRNRKRREDYFVCPHCGAEVPAKASACPECGSDESTGWADEAGKWAADIPTGYADDEEFDYDDFIRREFAGKGRGVSGKSIALLVAVAAALLGLLLLLLAGAL